MESQYPTISAVLAARTLEAEDWPVLTQTVKNHSVVVYHDLDPETGRPQSGRTVQIRLHGQNKSAHFAAQIGSARILILSRSGKRLLVGSTGPSSSTAELYDTETGTLIREWIAAAPLGGQVQHIPGQDVFADIAPQRRSIRLYSLADGEQLKSIDFEEPIEAFCPNSDGSAMVASLRSGELLYCDLASGSKTKKFSSPLIPVSWSPKNDVFAAFAPDEGTQYGSLVIAHCDTGSTISVVERGMDTSAVARFDVGGNVLFVHHHDIRDDELVRSMSPEMADRWLLSGIERYVVVDATGDAYWTVAHAAVPAVESLPTDKEQLRQRLGQSVTLEGTVAEVVPTVDMRRT